MDLVPYMFFERQEPGSQLCAQHCLNNILQQHTYTEFDLADIAQKLDSAENAALSLSNQNKKSYNLDDTGFFSISVLERALQVWDLTLVRWRGEAMKPYQDRPEEQSAFILHLAQHWLPLRRFAPSPPHTAAVKRWYNLNSFLPQPEWISPTYLKMVLTQAEQEGYSVFVIRRTGMGPGEGDMSEGEGWGDGGVGRLPDCLADNMAVELGEPVGRTGGMGASTTTDAPTVDPSFLPGPSSPPRSRRRRQQDLTGDLPSDDPFLSGPSGSTSARPRHRAALGELGLDNNDHDEEDEDIPDSAAFGDMHENDPTDFQHYDRAYDDEDAAFQAALRASMEDVPEGWTLPDLGKKAAVQTTQPVSAGMGGSDVTRGKRDLPVPPAPQAAVQPAQNWKPAGGAAAPAPVKVESAEKEVEEAPPSPVEELSQDEIRRRRLAKFGQ